jgi:protoporphyrinogen oxidase
VKLSENRYFRKILFKIQLLIGFICCHLGKFGCKLASQTKWRFIIREIAVIGAGPAGLTAAFELQKSGLQVTLFEASGQVGGMAKSFNLWGQVVDIGPHRFFSSDPRVNSFWLKAVDEKYEMVSRLTRIFYKKKFFSYPIEARNALFRLGIFESMRCVLSLLKVKIFPRKDESKFDNWVINRFGLRLFDIFFKSYTEKLWGINCADLDSDFAAQRIKKLSLLEALRSAFSKKTTSHRTLIDEFAYPIFGAGFAYSNLANKFVSLGGQIHLNSKINEIALSDDHVKIVDVDGNSSSYEKIISTMPLTNLVKIINAPDDICELAGQLKFRNTILVYLKVQGSNPFPDQWIYIHASNLRTGRITNFSNWTSRKSNSTLEHIVCLEFWCYNEDPIWNSEDQGLIEIAKTELIQTTLIQTQVISDGHVVRVPKCYPVYSTGYKKLLDPIQNYLNSVDRVIPIGRYGSFKYNNQDHSILMGLLAAENILGVSNHDLWAINSDYEYQESARITSTGLVYDKD